MRSRRALQLGIGVVLALVATLPGDASGPRSVDGAGQPMRWDNTAAIVYNPDKGPLGTLTNAQADALLADAFARWQGIAQVDLTFSSGAELAQDVNAVGLPSNNPAHWGHFWRKDGDGLSPVIYDVDGSITDDMFGIGARFDILGAAGLDNPISLSGTITGGSIILNGAFQDGQGLPASPDDSQSQLAFEATIVHEVGHFLNLDHSMVNHELAGDHDPDNDVYLSTMYPLTADNEEFIASPNPDDEAGVLALYPSAGAAAARWSIAGMVSGAGAPFQGAEIIVRKVGDPLMFAYEAISGARFFPCNVGGACYPCDASSSCSSGNLPEQGEFSISGMMPGDYTVHVEQLDRRISVENGTFVGPLATPPVLPGPEECYNTGDSADPTLDDPDNCTTLTQAAGSSATGIDIALDDFMVSDTFEPNNTLGAATPLTGLGSSGSENTVGAVLGSGDLDFYSISVVSGHVYQIDLEAAEIGSTLDPVIGMYDGAGALIQAMDDGLDPDSGMQTPDPALTYQATFTGNLRIVISSFPDTDLDGVGGGTTGPYWLRVGHDADSDNDGIVDRLDACPNDSLDDADKDGICGNADNCPSVYNPGQDNADGDAYGDACDSNQVLASIAAITFSSSTTNAHVGSAVASAGDYNNDGTDDVLVGGPGLSGSGRGLGFDALPSGLLLAPWAFPPAGGSQYGVWMAGVGDYDCNGADDFVIGQPSSQLFDLVFCDEFGPEFQNPYSGSSVDPIHFGFSLAGAGDVNHDGVRDLLVGDPDWGPVSATQRGKVFLYLFNPACGTPDNIPDWSADGGADGTQFGASVASAGDVNGDNYADVLVGAPGYSDGEAAEGGAFLYLGSSGGPSASADWSAESNEAAADFGRSVAGIGDVNGDGYGDVAVGAPLYDGAGIDRGRVSIYMGSATGLSPTPALLLDGDQTNAQFGSSVAAAGDVNGDGFADLAVGAPSHSGGGTARGRVYLYLGSAGGLSATPGKTLSGEQDNSHFGNAVASAGHVNADAFADLLVGAKDFDNSATSSDGGRAYLFLASSGLDRDGDGVDDQDDNCRDLYNPSQSDGDQRAGPDGQCNTLDDNLTLSIGPDNVCGTGDDVVGDRVGDACATYTLNTGISSSLYQTSSAAWGDYNGDGRLDLWLSGTGAIAAKLLRNDGSGSFTNVTPSAWTTAESGGVWGDYDNDGDIDLFVYNLSSTSRLYKNTGGGNFTSIALPAFSGVNSASWIDYDRDGDLDLYVTTNQTLVGGRFYRNDGGDVFTLVSVSPFNALDQTGSSWQDIDGDGDEDVALASAFGIQIYRNDGGGVYSLLAAPTPLFNIGLDWGDYDNDGDPDLFAGPQVLRNDGASTFKLLDLTSVTTTIGFWFDAENDGDLDLFRGGNLYRNDGNNSFPLLREAVTLGFSGQFEADFDKDGRLDVFLSTPAGTSFVRSRLVRNSRDLGNHWLELDLTGTVSNRSAIGARVLARTGGTTRRREVTSVGLTGPGHPLRLHFGLGAATNVDSLEIHWPSGAVQILENVPVDQVLGAVEADGSSPTVTSVYPANGTVDASLYTNIVLQMSKAIDPATVDNHSITVAHGGVKAEGTLRVSTDRFRITFDPSGQLDPDADYQVQVGAGVRDLFGNPAAPFSSGFDTGLAGGSVPLPVDLVGEQQSGAVVGGQNFDDQSGTAVASLGDVNGDGLGDLLIGAPNSDDGANVDAGRATLVFGQFTLNGRNPPIKSVQLVGEGILNLAGRAVASAGDMNDDGLADFLVAAPFASPNGTASGKAYLVFGNAGLDELSPSAFPLGGLAACSPPAPCGIVFTGEAAGDLAGAALGAAGDINNDGFGDLLIAAPGASPEGRSSAGKIYLIYGPLGSPGVIPLSTVGVTQPGLVFLGENPGDFAGTSVSRWDQYTGDGIDDLLIGAPGADAEDDFGVTVPDAGYVYAIHGGSANLQPNPVSPATIELSRIANAAGDQVSGMVFIGSHPGRSIGRSVTGAVDVNGDGVPDIAIGAHGEASVIPGNGPKTQSGTSKVDPHPTIVPIALIRQTGHYDALQQFGATFFTAGTEGDLGDIVVSPAGDINGDGLADLILGVGDADLPGKADAGKAYIIFGSPDFPSGEIPLSEVGDSFPGIVIQGAETGDHLGAAVSGGFDVNADGVADVLVGAPFADALPGAPTDAGETYIISFGVAGEVSLVTADLTDTPPGGTFLEWTASSRALSYNVYRGDAATLIPAGAVMTSNMTQIACGITTDSDSDNLPDLIDAAVPAVNQAFFYLVTGRNLSGEGPLGSLGTASPRILDSQCP